MCAHVIIVKYCFSGMVRSFRGRPFDSQGGEGGGGLEFFFFNCSAPKQERNPCSINSIS